MRRVVFGVLAISGIVYSLHHLQNENGLKPTLQKSIVKIVESINKTPSDVTLLESNIPLKFLVAMPGEVDSLVRINKKTIKITHHVEFFGMTPIVSLVTGSGMYRVRISEDSRRLIIEMKELF